jgi:hypothetical protein
MNLNKTPEGQKKVKALIFNIPLYIHLNANPNFDKTKFIEEYKKYLNSNMINLPKNISKLPKELWNLILHYLFLEDGSNFLKALKS